MTIVETTPRKRSHVNGGDGLEQEIEHAIRNRTPGPVSIPKLEDLGRMSGEAVLAQYEAAAKAVEEMGHHVKDAVAQLGEALIRCDADLKFITETADAIRDKGQRSREMVEKFSEMSKAIRETCHEFKRKMEV